MPIIFPTYDEIKKMPDNRIKGLNIDSKEKEALVQRVINERNAANPPVREIYRGDIPFEIKSKEEELKWQKILDDRRLAAQSKPIPVSEEVELVAKVSDLEAEKKALESPFCLHCDSRGVRHKKDCKR